jgi:hypothetical protein
MIAEPQRIALLEGSKLKLAAKARLAEGGREARYEASVLLHAAARAERRLMLTMDASAAEARLVSAVERCGCLIDGADPTAVLADAWRDVLDASDRVSAVTRGAIRGRIDPKMSRFVAEYQRVLTKTPALKAWMEAGAPWAGARAMLRELNRFLSAFPGDARAWVIKSAAHQEAGDAAAAWSAVRRARDLSPEDMIVRPVEISLVPLVLPPAEAASRLDAVYAEILRGEASADLCFGFIGAALALARRGTHRRELLQQAFDCATEGLTLQPLGPGDHKALRAMQLILREMIAGRKPGLDILYRCGLGTLAAARASEDDKIARCVSFTQILEDHGRGRHGDHGSRKVARPTHR